MSLQTEHAAYKQHLGEMLKTHDGQYVVIKGPALMHFSPSYEEALDWGYETYGLDESFFVKKVTPDGDVIHFTRDFGHPCRT